MKVVFPLFEPILESLPLLLSGETPSKEKGEKPNREREKLVAVVLNMLKNALGEGGPYPDHICPNE